MCFQPTGMRGVLSFHAAVDPLKAPHHPQAVEEDVQIDPVKVGAFADRLGDLTHWQ